MGAALSFPLGLSMARSRQDIMEMDEQGTGSWASWEMGANGTRERGPVYPVTEEESWGVTAGLGLQGEIAVCFTLSLPSIACSLPPSLHPLTTIPYLTHCEQAG